MEKWPYLRSNSKASVQEAAGERCMKLRREVRLKPGESSAYLHIRFPEQRTISLIQYNLCTLLTINISSPEKKNLCGHLKLILKLLNQTEGQSNNNKKNCGECITSSFKYLRVIIEKEKLQFFKGKQPNWFQVVISLLRKKKNPKINYSQKDQRQVDEVSCPQS